MLNKLIPFLQKPAPYAKSTSAFWNDDHISRGMLAAHLDFKGDGATRNLEFVDKSIDWITSIFPPEKYPKLLDLGCGPGVYAEKFHEKGFRVTGVDFSERSINHALENAAKKSLDIRYIFQDYLKLSYDEEFDITTMIYCDFGVLSDGDRKTLLRKIYNALKPQGALIFDVFTPNFYNNKVDARTWEYCKTGFFSEKPYLNMESFYRYDDCSTFLDQYIIFTDNDVQCYNIWNHGFTVGELKRDLADAGFADIELFGDISGAAFDAAGDTICIAARKEG